MPGAATLLATFAAGLASFVAPCTLPLLPAYLSYVSGVAVADIGRPGAVRARLVGGAVLYVLGFSTVLVLTGLGVAGLSRTRLAGEYGRPLEIAAGAVLVVLGLALAGVVRIGVLQRDRHAGIAARLRGSGPLAAYPLGVVIGIGWSPCVGPYLAAALTLAAAGSHPAEGAVLLGAYSLGLGVPFIAAALAGASLPDLGTRLRRWAQPLSRAGAVMVMLLGLALLSGEYSRLSSWLAQAGTPA